jgi:hypothetical protein
MGGSGTPLWLLVVFVVAVAILVAVGSILLANRILSAVGKEHNSTVLCIVFSLDHPFGSERGITAAPFQHALEVFDAVDRGT